MSSKRASEGLGPGGAAPAPRARRRKDVDGLDATGARGAVLGSPDLAGLIARLDPRALAGLSAACRDTRAAAGEAVGEVRAAADAAAEEALGILLAAREELEPVARRLEAMREAWRLVASRRVPFAWRRVLELLRGRVDDGTERESERDFHASAFDETDLAYADGGRPRVPPLAANDAMRARLRVDDLFEGHPEAAAWHERRILHAAARAMRLLYGLVAEVPDLNAVAFCAPLPPFVRPTEVAGRLLDPLDGIVLVDPIDLEVSLVIVPPVPGRRIDVHGRPFSTDPMVVPLRGLEVPGRTTGTIGDFYDDAVREGRLRPGFGLPAKRFTLALPEGGKRTVERALNA